MNLLFIVREFPPLGGGTGNVARILAEEFSQLGHRIDILTMHFGNLPKSEQRGNITIHRVPCGRRKQYGSYLSEMLRFALKSRPLARQIARNNRCQFIQAFALIPDGLIAVDVGNTVKIPVILRASGTDVPGHDPNRLRLAHKIARPLWHWTMDNAHAVVAPSKQLAERIHTLRPTQHVHVIPNGIKLDTFSPTEKDGSFLICSRLINLKNFDLFFRAFAQVVKPQVLHVAGDGPMLTKLKQLGSAMPQHKVVFHGWLENGSKEWRRLYETCQYFVLPSANESFGISLLEAQLAGMIVLASRIPVFEDVLGNNAVYFEKLNAATMAKTLNSVVSGDFDGSSDLVRNATERIRKEFSSSVMAHEFLSLFERIGASK